MSLRNPKPHLLSAAAAAAGPWRPIEPLAGADGYVSYYYADELARLPIRAVTKIRDNKSDPNIETGTYGLFSTCQEKMRSGIVRSRPRYIFFITKPRKRPRELAGMYELGWSAPGSFSNRSRDFALAARAVRFVTPVPFGELPGELSGLLDRRWRLDKRIGPGQAEQLAAYLRSKPDRTPEYLAEVERMEQVNEFHSGYRYPTWRRTDPWSWNEADRYLAAGPPVLGSSAKVANSSPSDWWHCDACGEEFENQALLKACPGCGAIATLQPMAKAPLLRKAA
jgi:hypothetical protein